MMLPAMLPTITPHSAEFWDSAKRGILALPHCDSCGHTWYPPSSRCPNCLSQKVMCRAASGRGTLWSWVLMHREYFKGFPPPYVVAFVKLEESPMMISTIMTPDEGKLYCGMPLTAVFEKVTDDVSLVKFRAA